jgi:hypothetical protein
MAVMKKVLIVLPSILLDATFSLAGTELKPASQRVAPNFRLGGSQGGARIVVRSRPATFLAAMLF